MPGRRWLMPDLALIAALATLVCVFAGSAGFSGVLRDSDTGWHIRNGERILASRALPSQDPFSFAKAGEPWISWEWGTDVIDAATHSAWGLNGIVVIYGMAIAACIWVWFRLAWQAGANFLIAPLLAAPAIAASSLHWLARPHIFGWLFTLIAVWWCESRKSVGISHLIAIGGFCALWANVHASFFLGPVIALVYAAGTSACAIYRDGPHRGPAADEGVRPTARGYLLAAAAGLMGTLINPYGWRLHEHVLSYLTDSALLNRIQEFQSFNFHNDGAASVMLVFVFAIGGAFAGLAARRPERFLLSLLLTAAAFRSARAIPIAALVLLPLAAGSFTELLELAYGLKPQFRTFLDRALRYGESLRSLDRKCAGWLWIPVALALVLFVPHARASFSAKTFPVSAAGSVAKLPDDARIFSTDAFGGYLIYRFAGERPVFFDGRSDFYGAQFIERYARMLEARPGWRAEFERWHFTHALLPPDAPLIDALETAGWHELHRDSTAVLMRAR